MFDAGENGLGIQERFSVPEVVQSTAEQIETVWSVREAFVQTGLKDAFSQLLCLMK